MLEPPGHDAGSYAKPAGESSDGRHAEIVVRSKAIIVCRRNQEIAGEGVGLRFAGVASGGFRVAILHEHGAFAVFQDVAGFMENVNQRWSSVLPRKLSWISALVECSQRVAP